MVIIVVIDEPVGAHHGGDVAAPVFHEIAESVLPYLNVAPDIEAQSAPDGSLIAQRPATSMVNTSGNEETDPEENAQQAMLPKVAHESDDGQVFNEVVYAVAGEHALLMPDLRRRSVRDAARICAQLGLELEASGQGRAVRQNPAAGSSVEAGQVVHVDFMRSD